MDVGRGLWASTNPIKSKGYKRLQFNSAAYFEKELFYEGSLQYN